MMIWILLLSLTIPIETELLITAGEKVGAKSVIEGTLNEDFLEMSQEHARLQARMKRQGHQKWKKRYTKLHKKYPNLTLVEIASESWKGQTFEEAAKDAFEVSWPASKGHWKVANSPCKYYGIFMAHGKNNIVYCSMIVGVEK